MLLTLIRHSKTVLEREVPNPLWKLSGTGIADALRMGKREEIKSVELMYSSLQNKALHTTVLLANNNPARVGKLNEIFGFLEDFDVKVFSY